MTKKNVITTVWPVEAWLSESAAHYIVMASNKAVAEKGSFSIALSGGSTPKQLYKLLAQVPFKNNIPWDKVFIAFGDERFVARTSNDSNYKMASTTLLNHVPIPKKNILGIETKDITPEKAALAYEQQIKKDIGTFDLILLGVGEEGHTASIFPNSPLMNDTKRLVKEVWVEEKKMYRISFTLPFINKATNIMMLVSGDNKAEIIKKINSKAGANLPAANVNAKESTFLLLDKAAAGL
jgi:6-phosphogluconolactonase